MSGKSKKTAAVVGAFLLFLAAVAVYFCVFHKYTKDDLAYDDNAITGILPGIDIDERRKELQKIVDRNMIAFSVNTSPVFLNGTSKGNLLIENPGNNGKLLKASITIDETKEEVYSTKYLKPGTYIESAKLDKVLKEGTYNATVHISAYDEYTAEYIGKTGAQIVITVQN